MGLDLFQHAQEHALYLRSLCGTDCVILDTQQRSFQQLPPEFCRERCPFYETQHCHCQNTHLYGCFESERWCGKYIYYCPGGLVFTAASLFVSEHRLIGGMICGPAVMSNDTDLSNDLPEIPPESLKPLPIFSTEKVRYLSELTYTVAVYCSGLSKEMVQSEAVQHDLHNTLYDISGIYGTADSFSYPIDFEKRLQELIKAGNKKDSQELLNQLLGHIYFCSGGDFETIKARIIELVVILSRATIDNGGDLNQIFGWNTYYLKELEQMQDLRSANQLLTEVLHRFTSFTFDFQDVKHVDILHKAVDFIQERYTEKITLDDLGEHVHLSKSYLSRIFKDELNTTFTNYVNNLRVEKSKPLLLNKQLSLADIALQTGFEDQSYFTKVFKKRCGISPGKYRELRGNTILTSAPSRIKKSNG